MAECGHSCIAQLKALQISTLTFLQPQSQPRRNAFPCVTVVRSYNEIMLGHAPGEVVSSVSCSRPPLPPALFSLWEDRGFSYFFLFLSFFSFSFFGIFFYFSVFFCFCFCVYLSFFPSFFGGNFFVLFFLFFFRVFFFCFRLPFSPFFSASLLFLFFLLFSSFSLLIFFQLYLCSFLYSLFHFLLIYILSIFLPLFPCSPFSFLLLSSFSFRFVLFPPHHYRYLPIPLVRRVLQATYLPTTNEATWQIEKEINSGRIAFRLTREGNDDGEVGEVKMMGGRYGKVTTTARYQ